MPQVRFQKERGEVEQAESDNHLEGTWTSSRGQQSITKAQGGCQDLICIRENWLAGTWIGSEAGKAREGRPEHGHGYGETECFQRKEMAAELTTARDQIL